MNGDSYRFDFGLGNKWICFAVTFSVVVGVGRLVFTS